MIAELAVVDRKCLYYKYGERYILRNNAKILQMSFCPGRKPIDQILLFHAGHVIDFYMVFRCSINFVSFLICLGSNKDRHNLDNIVDIQYVPVAQ